MIKWKMNMNFEKTNEIMNILGYEHSIYQENKRI